MLQQHSVLLVTFLDTLYVQYKCKIFRGMKATRGCKTVGTKTKQQKRKWCLVSWVMLCDLTYDLTLWRVSSNVGSSTSFRAFSAIHSRWFHLSRYPPLNLYRSIDEKYITTPSPRILLWIPGLQWRGVRLQGIQGLPGGGLGPDSGKHYL